VRGEVNARCALDTTVTLLRQPLDANALEDAEGRFLRQSGCTRLGKEAAVRGKGYLADRNSSLQRPLLIASKVCAMVWPTISLPWTVM